MLQSARRDYLSHHKGRALAQRFRKSLTPAIILASTIAMTGVHAETARGVTPVEEPARFDIPSQSLEDALIAYAGATGVEVFVDHALASDQRSSPVQGIYKFEEALRLLLMKTGLEYRRAADRAYTLVAPPLQEPPAGSTPNWSGDSQRRQFFAALQLAIKQTLCARPDTAPGQYRAALAIWIGPTGNVVNARVLGANVHEQTARSLTDVMQRISIGQSPPPGLEQPVTFVILPRSPDHTGDCGSRNTGRG
jgi:hypothetical protein